MREKQSSSRYALKESGLQKHVKSMHDAIASFGTRSKRLYWLAHAKSLRKKPDMSVKCGFDRWRLINVHAIPAGGLHELEDTALIKLRATRKLPECDRCRLCAHEPFLVCAVHPYEPEGDTCPDPELEGKRFEDFLCLESQQRDNERYTNPYDLESAEELWEPAGASYYNGELIVQPHQRWTREEMMGLLDWHPMFTGRCPRCGAEFDRDYTARCIGIAVSADGKMIRCEAITIEKRFLTHNWSPFPQLSRYVGNWRSRVPSWNLCN